MKFINPNEKGIEKGKLESLKLMIKSGISKSEAKKILNIKSE